MLRVLDPSSGGETYRCKDVADPDLLLQFGSIIQEVFPALYMYIYLYIDQHVGWVLTFDELVSEVADTCT
jgi:hypothetical protein